MNILNFVNAEPKTIFAPQWNYVIFEADISKLIDLEKLKNIILEKGHEIVKKYNFTSDWGTGLGDQSLTSRSNSYNLMACG